MFNLLVRVRCTSFPEIRVMCLLTLAFSLFCVKYPSRLCSFESNKYWNRHFFFKTHYRQMVRGFHVNLNWWCCSNSSHSPRFMPFFYTPVSPILVLVVINCFCRFSVRRILVTATQRLLFRWKYPRRSSFFVSSPQNKWKDANSPKGYLYQYCGEKVSVWINRVLRTKTLGNMYSGDSAGDSISRVPCTCLYKLIKIPSPLNFSDCHAFSSFVGHDKSCYARMV